MKLSLSFFLVFVIFSLNAQNSPPAAFEKMLKDSPHIKGKTSYLHSPFVTAGNRVYMVGAQDGSFPEIGWHIKGEMGGIWDHPIKLMDGFRVKLIWENSEEPLDSAAVFVNFPMANKHVYKLPQKNLEVERWQFVPDEKQGLFIQYVLKNTGEKLQNFNLEFTGYSDLRPTWLGERTKMKDGQDTAYFDKALQAWKIKDEQNDWYLLFGATKAKLITPQREESAYSGNGAGASLTYPLSISAGESKTISFVIAGSYISEAEATATYSDISEHAEEYLRKKKQRYENLAEKSKLTIPDKKLQQAFEWLKYNADWLVRTVPEIGTGIGAGIPDYPWFFGVDSEYSLQGYMAVGQDKVVYKTIRLLDSVSEAVNGNGRIIHEMSTNGAVFNKGNINETPQFASLIWEIYKWNGDKNFLKQYFPTIKKGLQWLLEENDANGNLFPDGFGMMEIHGLDSEMIDVAVYTQRAFVDAAKIASELNENKLASDYAGKAAKLKQKINDQFWAEEFNSYADFIGTEQQALRLIEDAIVRADTLQKPWAVSELKNTREKILKQPSEGEKAFVLYHNWVVNTPMEMNIADQEKAEKALRTAEKFLNPFGLFVTGIDRDESAGKDEGSFKGSKVFSYTGAVMTLPTGVLAIAENNYGHPDKALDLLNRMTRSFSYALPGSMYEVSPDYGMMTQAWNIYAFAIPIVQQFFGIDPMASEKEVLVKPQMPSSWNKASLENVEIGQNKLSVFFEETAEGKHFRITQTDAEWKVKLILPQHQKRLKVLAGKSSETGENIEIVSDEKNLEVWLLN
ncbi:MAG: glycogen debranching protein [Salegentibacter sp.]